MALSRFLEEAGADAIIQLPPHRPSPMVRQFVSLVAELAQPGEILISKGLPLEQNALPVGPEEVALGEGFPDVVRHAQRKAQWIKLIEDGEDHEIELSKVSIEGGRLGSGQRIREKPIGALHMEVCGATLLIIVADKHPEDAELARALDASHCSRVHVVEARAYDGLLCSFARQSGEDFGMGFIKTIDFESGLINAGCTGVGPDSVRTVRIGGLQLDVAGNEIGEARPWQV